MALSQRLDLRQTQTLIMTPQLQQAIKLLQLSNVELAEYVEDQIERNPLLEREDNDGVNADVADGEQQDRSPVEPAQDVTGTDALARVDHLPAEADAPLDTDFENVWTNSSATDPCEAGANPPSVESEPSAMESLASWGTGGKADFSDGAPGLENTAPTSISLRDHVFQQINLDFARPSDRLIARRLFELVDEAGYLVGDVNEAAEALGCPTARVDAVLTRLQRFDPPGLFARSLAECLALQLADRNRLDPAMQALLDNLDLLARRDLAALTAVCGVDREDLSDMIAEIRALDPKPALAFSHEPAQPVTPDILMRPGRDGGWVVELNSETLPKVLVNHRYYTEVSAAAPDKAARDYLAECFADANWLVKSLHQRATTILKVGTELVRQQQAFFAHGVQKLKPLILRDIAEAIGMHESTVSRVTSNKFIATPRGVFELKYFFTAAIAGADGREAHSAEAVRFRIKALIDDEPADKILSDDQIVEILRTDGIDIARRTVAKYREALRIPSSVQRRREKSLAAWPV